jgi:hypothetical protein
LDPSKKSSLNGSFLVVLASDHHLGSKRSIRCSVSDSAI